MGSGKSFDINIVKLDGDTRQFKNLDKAELKVLMQYFKKANIKMRQIDPDSNRGVDLNDINSDEVEEEIRASQTQGEAKDAKGVTVSRSGRRRVPVVAPQMELPPDDDESEDDDDFDGNNGEEGDNDDEESFEDEMDDIDDDKIGKDELKDLTK